MAAAAVALILGVAAGARFLAESGDGFFTDDAGDVEVRQVIVFNGLTTTNAVNGRLLQTKASTPHLDISVLNSGSRPVLLTKAVITIVDSGHLALCRYHFGDMVPVSWKYAVELPVLPLPSEKVVSRTLHQEIPPEQVDRFKLFFRLPLNGLDDHVYALRIAFATDRNESVDAGAVVIGLPDAVLPNGPVLPYGSNPFDALDRRERLMSTWCGRRNMADLKRILGRPGRRSARMSALAELRPGGWWRRFVDPRPPKTAARLLLKRPNLPDAPVLAVFAADRSGDPQFAALVRHRAAAALLRQAERSLRLGYPYAAWNAVVTTRQADRFSPSSKGKNLLAQAESRWEVARMRLTTGWGQLR